MADKPLKPLSSDQERRAFLDKVRSHAPTVRGPDAGQRARLMFALDATASREHAWDIASHYHAQMFSEANRHGELEIQLCFYRGYGEFKTTPWHHEAAVLQRAIVSVSCLAGRTQIAKLLRHALKETARQRIQAVVFIGDCVEESVDKLGDLAGQLGIHKVPLFIFQDGDDAVAARAFAHMAKLSGGAHCRFDAASANELGELLAAVASFASGGKPALKAIAANKGARVAALLEQLK